MIKEQTFLACYVKKNVEKTFLATEVLCSAACYDRQLGVVYENGNIMNLADFLETNRI